MLLLLVCPQQLLAPFLKLTFPDIPEDIDLRASSCCLDSSNRTCCLGSLKFVLPSAFSVSLVISFSYIKGLIEHISGFP